MSSTAFCFTNNNYTSEHEDYLKALDVKYLVYGYEECPTTGTPHLQGFVVFKKKIRLTGAKKLLPHCHVTTRYNHSTNEEAANYCKKENQYYEKGTLHEQGKRNDLLQIKKLIENGASIEEIRDNHYGSWVRYKRSFEEHINSLKPIPTVPTYPLITWQEKLNEILEGPPNDREVIFVVDVKGNAGKSWFAKHYAQLNPGKVQILKPGKKADMAYELRTDIRVLIMDCPRSRSEVLDYEFLESLKDQMVFSGKYMSTTKMFQEPLHVLVLMNEFPDPHKLSEDRYHLIDASPPPFSFPVTRHS